MESEATPIFREVKRYLESNILTEKLLSRGERKDQISAYRERHKQYIQ
jgi:hypothetical protein